MEKRGKEAESGRNKLPWKEDNLVSKTEKKILHKNCSENGYGTRKSNGTIV